MAYNAKDPIVAAQALVVQKLSLPFTITHNATPASKSSTRDNPSILFLKLEGTGQDQITGALTTSETTPSLATATDSTGVFNAMVRLNETAVKSYSAKLVYRTPAASAVTVGKCLGVTTGTGTGTGTALCFDFTAIASLATTDVDAVIEIEYTVQH